MSFDEIINRDCYNTTKFVERESKFGRNDVIPLWIADMDFACPNFLLEAIQDRAKHPVFGSVAPPSSAISAQIDWLAQHQNYEVKQDWVLSTHSVIAAVHMAIQTFTAVGDEVVIMTPVYQGFAQSVANEKRTLLNWPLVNENGKYLFAIEDLEKIVSTKTKMLLLCSPHNPVGRVWTADELSEISAFCEAHGIIVVADEIHADLVYQPNTFRPYATINVASANHSITIQGPAKSFNLTGLPLASVIISNPKLREPFAKTHQNFHPSHGDTFSQVAFETVYRQGYTWLHDLKTYLQKNQTLIRTELASQEIQFHGCEATYLAWLDCRHLGFNDESQLSSYFVNDLGLGLSPGQQFGPGGEGYMRLNFATPAKRLEKALNRMTKRPFVNK